MSKTDNVFKKLVDMRNDDFSLDSLIDSMNDYSTKDLEFMRDCIDFMIIYNKYKREA